MTVMLHSVGTGISGIYMYTYIYTYIHKYTSAFIKYRKPVPSQLDMK